MGLEIETDSGKTVVAPKKVRWKSGWEKVRKGNVPKTKEARKRYFDNVKWGGQRTP